MQPRQQIYNFAHRILKQDAHVERSLWNIITGDRAYGYLATRWNDAADGEPSLEQKGMLFVEPIQRDGFEICLLHMPEPQAMTEPYYVAFVRSAAQPFPLRYFVLERSSAGGAYWAEWRPDMRIRGSDVPEWPADLAQRTALPYPYAATFVEAIAGELAAAPPVPAPATRAKPSSNAAIYATLGAVLVVIALIVLTRM